MRSKKALWNVVINAGVQIVHVILAFVVRKVFLATLGAEVLGLHSVFSSVLAFLSLTELGLGVSVSMCLYKPLAENDLEKIVAYMNFLGKTYFIIGSLIFGCGICLIPFLPVVINGNYDLRYIIVSFVLYLTSTSVTYFFSYKKVLLGADQKSYIVSTGQFFYKLILNLGQIIILLLTENYHLFLLVNIFCNIVENWVMSLICNKQYPYIKRVKGILNRCEKRNLLNKVKGMLCYNIGNYLIEGTDNIILSAFLGTVTVAYYSNYYLVINMLYAIFACFGTSAIAGLGNILYANKGELKNAFSKLLLVQHFVYSFSATALMVLVTDFVEIFFGKESVMPFDVVILMTGIYYVKGYSQGIEAFRSSVGLYEKDKYLNLVIAGLNVIVSVALVVHIGVAGVLVGTLLCYSIKELFIVPWYVMKEVLENGRVWYSENFIKHLFITILIMFFCYLIHQQLYVCNEYITWIFNGAICFAISIIVNLTFFWKTNEMKQIWETAKNIIWRKV